MEGVSTKFSILLVSTQIDQCSTSLIYTETHTELSSLPILPLVDINKKTYQALIMTLPLGVKVNKGSNVKSEFQKLGLLSTLNILY